MKSARPSLVDAPAHRRAQPVRQARTNPSRGPAHAGRHGAGGRDGHSGPAGDQPIDIFPAITHFADTITALPKELVRHFTLLKEVDAKLFGPEDQLFKLVEQAANAPAPEPRPSNDATGVGASSSAPMSTQNSSSGFGPGRAVRSAPPSDEPNTTAPSSVFDPSNIPRRQLFRQTAFKIQEMLVSLEEKNHVISTANEALNRQLARIEDVWPYLESEFSDEAKWGSTTHWAYPENRNGKAAHAERARRDGAAAISAAAQALAEEAAARSDARKQAVQAKRNQRNQHHDSDADDLAARHKGEGGKKAQSSKSRKTAEANVGLGITGATANGNPPPKRRKVEKTTNGGEPMERAMSSVFGNAAPKTKTSSPRGTPAPDGPKKRKALPTGSGQAKKKQVPSKNGMSPSVTSSPVMGNLPEPKTQARASPIPGSAPRPASSRARQNSIQSNADPNGRARALSSASTKPNGKEPSTPDMSSTSVFPRPTNEPKPVKETIVPLKPETIKKEADRPESSSRPPSTVGKKDSKDETDSKSESVPPQPQTTVTVTTKSGRASKPSTPALATFQEAARPRSSRNTDNGGASKKSHKKGGSVAQAIAPQVVESDANSSSLQGDDDDDNDIDADEPTYCYCNSVSYGEMVACDADECEREWFHLACVGLKVAPGSKTKWYCEDCKKRLKMGDKKASSR
ncbi:PHD finger domain-containingprotein (Ing1) [Purpureocillium lilacinum]|uniref:Chromatin modification-related protein n=1 Tax=Purpureocillium lilacinum TaxID=33203 RepID=A0A179GRW8_PURLI|nr:PHD finger domain-containingprotein (Ing1) [Purpureocillium lilacinum]